MWLKTACAVAILAGTASAEGEQLRELGNHTTEATIIVDAPPADVYAVVTSYARWPDIFSDVTWARVETGGRHDARVRFRSRALRNQTFTVAFANVADRTIAFRGVKGPPGGRAWGTMTLEPRDNGTRTFVIAQLHIDVVGPSRLVVRERQLREMRQAKLRADLADTAAYFVAVRRARERLIAGLGELATTPRQLARRGAP